MQSNIENNLLDVIKSILPLVISLIAAYLSYKLGEKKSRRENKLDFIKQQIVELYSPLQSKIYRINSFINFNEIIAVKLQVEVEKNSDLHLPLEKMLDQYKDIPKYFLPELDHFEERIFPIYSEMLALLTEKLWLADDSTIVFYDKLLIFVSVWEKADKIPKMVENKVETPYEEIKLFFINVQEVLTKLKKELIK